VNAPAPLPDLAAYRRAEHAYQAATRALRAAVRNREPLAALAVLRARAEAAAEELERIEELTDGAAWRVGIEDTEERDRDARDAAYYE